MREYNEPLSLDGYFLVYPSDGQLDGVRGPVDTSQSNLPSGYDAQELCIDKHRELRLSAIRYPPFLLAPSWRFTMESFLHYKSCRFPSVRMHRLANLVHSLTMAFAPFSARGLVVVLLQLLPLVFSLVPPRDATSNTGQIGSGGTRGLEAHRLDPSTGPFLGHGYIMTRTTPLPAGLLSGQRSE